MKRLLIRPGAIGDCIVSLPALEHLKAEYTEVWAPSQNLPLIRFADRVQSIVSTGVDAYPPRVNRLEDFDEIVSWYGTKRTEFRDVASRFPIQFLDALPTDNSLHAVDFYMRQVGGRDGAKPRISLPRTNAGFIAIHPYSGSHKKNWAGFEIVAKGLSAPTRFCVGPEQDWPAAERFADLFELAHWLATASLYIGNDCGITHLAAAVGTPVIAIFQASDPAVWAPRGVATIDILQRPTPAEVIATAENRLR